MNTKKLFLLFFVVFLGSCQTVTIRPEGGSRDTSTPTYCERESFFFWGASGQKSVDVKKICANKTVLQMQSQHTFLDGFLGLITLGIYAPRTVKVWCKA